MRTFTPNPDPGLHLLEEKGPGSITARRVVGFSDNTPVLADLDEPRLTAPDANLSGELVWLAPELRTREDGRLNFPLYRDRSGRLHTTVRAALGKDRTDD